jgi:drug/metabolite transporter (DMT)-like permease
MVNPLGILFAILACACWGLSMICPVLAPQFSAIEITLGRYFFYGLICLVLWAAHLIKRRELHSWRIWRKALIFALTGNLIYYALEVMGVKMIGPSMVALLFASNPICVSLYGNFLGKEVPYSMILLPLVMVGIGFFFVHANDINIDPSITTQSFSLGVLATAASITMWAWYAVHNARFLKKEADLNFIEFNMLIGVWCFFLTIASFPILLLLPIDSIHFATHSINAQEIMWFLAAALALGFLGSFMGTFFWQRASRMLPVTLAGQIIVAETCFGLLYTYLYQQQIPRPYELGGFILVIAGVLISLRRIQQYQLKVSMG